MGKYKNIYVLAPYAHATGGVELAHQLVDYINNKGGNAYIVYVNKDDRTISSLQGITKAYTSYNVKATNIIDDSKDNFLMLSEIYFDFALNYNKINIGCWWMSVDFRYSRVKFSDRLKFGKSILEKLHMIYSHYVNHVCTGYKNSDKIIRDMGDRVSHFYQSHYAQYHLYKNGFSNLYPLSDYINLDLLGDINHSKEDIVLYNPAKGYKFTKKIINALPDVKFIELKGLNRQELRSFLETAKLYIDFGHFPGKDRLPREAVSNGCCVITGKAGASYFFEDVPIGSNYKFESVDKNILLISERIKNVLANYEKCRHDFDNYRQIIKNEKEKFESEIESIFL